MEKEFAEFLSEELLKFCSYGSREDNLGFSATNRCEELDALSKLTSKEVEEYFTQHNNDYCSTSEANTLSIELSQGPSHTSKFSRKFATPKSDNEVAEARKAGVPAKTRKDTDWCFSIWEEWRNYRSETTKTPIPPMILLDKAGLNYWLSRFILEVKKKGDPPREFPPNTLHHICCGLQHYLRWNGKPDTDFFSDPAFFDFKTSLDAEMKRLQRTGIGSKQKQAEPLTHKDVEILWEKKLLGDSTPQSLRVF